MIPRLFQNCFQSSGEVFGFLFAPLGKLLVIVGKMQGGQDSDFQGIRRVGLRGDVAHALVDFLGEFPDFTFGQRGLEEDGIFLVVNFDNDGTGLYLRQETPQ